MLIRAFSDYHVHVRDGQILKDVVPYTTAHCGRFMVMPNLKPHIMNSFQMKEYQERIQEEIKHPSEVLMTISLTEETTAGTIDLAAEEGCTAVKLYPIGVTSNSEEGISRDTLLSLVETEGKDKDHGARRLWKNLEAIEESGMVLCIHGELPGEEVLKRESMMLPLVRAIFNSFKKIRVVLEHITTVDSVNFVSELDYRYKGRIAATITPHHLCCTLDDFLGGKLNPHLFCKPVLKTDDDREALQEAAVSRRKCFFLGSDSAPWPRDQKECSSGCAGVWNAPALVSMMFELFNDLDALSCLEDFTSTFGDLFYRRKNVDRQLNVEKDPWIMPSEIHGIVPFMAGREMHWKVVG